MDNEGRFKTTIEPGSVVGRIQLLINDDKTVESTEYFQIEIVGGTNLDTDWAKGQKHSLICAIVDNDKLVLALQVGTFDGVARPDEITAFEGDREVFVNVVLGCDVERKIDVELMLIDGTATSADKDYLLRDRVQTVTFSNAKKGDKAGINIPVLNDNNPNEPT